MGAALSPFLGRGAGSPSNAMSLWPRPTSIPSGILIHAAIWPQQTWVENWGFRPLFGEEELSPHLTQCGQDARPTCMPSFILIHPTVWPQYTKSQTDRLDRQRYDSIGRTVLQTVAQKPHVQTSRSFRYMVTSGSIGGRCLMSRIGLFRLLASLI